MKPQTAFSISAPGFMGLNLQDAPVELSHGYALVARNCVIDQYGRIGARKGWTKVNTTNTDLGSNDISCIGEVVENNGTITKVAAGGGFLFKLSGTTLTTLTYGGGGVAPTINANNWQFCQLAGIGIFWQRGYDPLIYDPAVSTTTFRRLNEKAGSAGTVQQANTAMAAYGRVWCADLSTNKGTLYWSDSLSPHIWSGGTSGSLDLRTVWPNGGDEVVSLAAHNNFLIIFGKRQTIIYSGANTPSTMTLYDIVNNIGCIARDSVQNIGSDVLFLSDNGVKSLLRTIQEKSAPLRDVSLNIKDDLINKIALANLDNLKSAYSPSNGFYLLSFPSIPQVYCFDLKRTLENGAARTTVWSGMNPKCFFSSVDRELYIGKAGFIGKYNGYNDDTASYTVAYYSTWVDFGEPMKKSILKKIMATIIGSPGQQFTFKWAYDFNTTYYSESTSLSAVSNIGEYGVSEYNIAEYYGDIFVNILSAFGKSNGKVVQFGFEVIINGSALSIQKIDAYTKEGRY